MRVPFNPKIGRIKTDASNFAVDRSFLAHYHIDAADVTAESELLNGAHSSRSRVICNNWFTKSAARNVKVKASAPKLPAQPIRSRSTARLCREEISEINPNGTTAAEPCI